MWITTNSPPPTSLQWPCIGCPIQLDGQNITQLGLGGLPSLVPGFHGSACSTVDPPHECTASRIFIRFPSTETTPSVEGRRLPCGNAVNFLKSTNESDLGISHLYACKGERLSCYIRIFGMGLNNFIKLGVGWVSFILFLILV